MDELQEDVQRDDAIIYDKYTINMVENSQLSPMPVQEARIPSWSTKGLLRKKGLIEGKEVTILLDSGARSGCNSTRIGFANLVSSSRPTAAFR